MAATWKYMGKKADGTYVDLGFNQTLPTMYRTLVIPSAGGGSNIFGYGGRTSGGTNIFLGDYQQYYHAAVGMRYSSDGVLIGSTVSPVNVGSGYITISVGETITHYNFSGVSDTNLWATIGAKSQPLLEGNVIYGPDGTRYNVAKVYIYNVTATTNPVSGTKVGNIALYDSDNNLVAGSVSKTSATASTASISYSFMSEATSVSVKCVATAVVGSTTTSKTTWHQKYFFNGITAKGSPVSDSDTTYTEATAACTISFGTSDVLTFVVDYGPKYKLSILSIATGVSSASISYTRTRSSGSYVTTAISPISVSGVGDVYIESGRLASFTAACSSGYVFATGKGFSSTKSSGAHNVFGSGSASISASNIGPFTTAESWNLTNSSYTINVEIAGTATEKTWGTVYIDTSGTTSKTLVLGTTYTFGFVSSRSNYEAPTVASWYVNGVAITGNSYTASALSGNVAVTCRLQQNAYQVTVSAGSNGSVVIAGRYNKTTGAALANTGYLFADGRDYMRLTVTPDAHYDEISSSRVISNLTEYATGGLYCYSLTASGVASAAFYFALAECVIRMNNNNPTLCDVSPVSQTMRFDSIVLVNIYCQIQSAHVGDYRVDYFEMDGAQYTAEVGGTGQYYYMVSAATIAGKSQVTFTPHLVSTANTLSVTKSGNISFATAYVSVNGVEESMSGSAWTGQVRENASVVCRAVVGFGGKIDGITYTGIVSPSVTDSQISFTMPSNNATVDFAISEKDKVTLALCVANATDPAIAVGKITLTCAQSALVHEEVDTLSTQSFLIYKNTTYRLTASDSDATYTFAGWYLNDTTLVSTALYIDISRSDLSSKYTAKYVMRGTGTITTSYGIKSGDLVIPTVLPTGGLPFGLAIDTPPDQTSPDKWVIGNSRYIDFHVLDDGTSVESGITYVWTPVRVDVMADDGVDTWTTVWTYDANNPTSRSGRFVMRDDMLVRLVFTKVQAAGYGRVQAVFKDGNTHEMGELSIFSTDMLTYYSIGGVAEANCYIGRKAVLTASPMPGWAFGGWYKFVGGAFVPITDADVGITVNGCILTIDQVLSSGACFYADFASADSNVKAFAEGSIPKTFEWRSKVYVGAQFFALRNVRIYSDIYPVGLRIMTATSPNGCFTTDARTLDLTIQDQSPRHIPVMRLEKYFAFRVTGAGRVNHVALASSMEALK